MKTRSLHVIQACSCLHTVMITLLKHNPQHKNSRYAQPLITLLTSLQLELDPIIQPIKKLNIIEILQKFLSTTQDHQSFLPVIKNKQFSTTTISH